MEPNQSIPSTEQVLAAVRQMSIGDLEKVVGEAVSTRASRLVTRLPDDELRLLERINAVPAAESERRFRELRSGFEANRLTPDEYRDLLELTERREAFHVERMRALSDLARLRGVTLPEIMDQLGIRFPEHG